jgi:hypothetical protein
VGAGGSQQCRYRAGRMPTPQENNICAKFVQKWDAPQHYGFTNDELGFIINYDIKIKWDERKRKNEGKNTANPN